MPATIEGLKKQAADLMKGDANRENPNAERFAQIGDAMEGAVRDGYEPGERVALSIMAVGATIRQGPEAAVRFLSDTLGEKEMADDISRTMSQQNPKEGGLLVPEQWTDEIVPLIRDRTILLSLMIRILENPTGDISMLRIAAAMKAYWKPPEGGKIKTTQSKFGRLRLRDKALTVIVPVYNKLLRNAPGIRSFIRDELGTTFGIAIDESAFFGAGGEDEPAGLFTKFNGGDDNSKTDANVVDLTTFTADSLIDMLLAHIEAKGTMANLHWVMSPRVWAKLMKMQYGAGNDSGYIFRDEMTRGTLMGIPFKMSTIVKDKSATEGRLMLADWNEYILAPSRPMEFLETNVGGYYDANGNVVPVLATDETAVRALWGGDMGPRLLQSFTMSNDVEIA